MSYKMINKNPKTSEGKGTEFLVESDQNLTIRSSPWCHNGYEILIVSL